MTGIDLSFPATSMPVGRNEATEWDAALSGLADPASLLQSYCWGEVYRRLGWRPERVRLPSGGRALVLIKGAGPLCWGYAPRGPVPATMETVVELIEWARSKRLSMLRVEPEGTVELRDQLRAAGFQRGRSIEPRHTAIIRLLDPDAMLASFRRTTRYNIRFAERQGVTVEEVQDAQELFRQLEVTANRHGVRMEDRRYFRALVDCLPDVHLYVARHEGVALAANLVARYDGRSYYLLAGSNGVRRELKPNYALLWRALADARAAGCTDHDLYGMPPPSDPDHPWIGLSQFKSGFSGTPVEYTGTWEIALAPGASQLLRAWHRGGRRVERLALRLRRARAGPGQSREAGGTSQHLTSAEPMAVKREGRLNT